MKKIGLGISLVAMLINAGYGQKAAKSVYFELGGAGLASVNYDMRFSKKESGLGFRVGAGGFTETNNYGYGTEKNTIITVPLELNYLLGKGGRHYFEMGAGATLIAGSSASTYSGGGGNTDKFSTTFGHLYFGYRLQPKDGGFLFRAGITPIFGRGYFFPYFAGISFGYKF